MLLLIHLVQYGQCHMEFEYTEQGSVHGSLAYGHVSFVCPYGYTNGGFLAIGADVMVFKFRPLLHARTTVAISESGRISMALAPLQFFKKAIRTQRYNF